MPGMSLMHFGPVKFQVYPLNFHEADHRTGADWARKDILESSVHREWVGHSDEEFLVRGRCFPFQPKLGFGAVSAIDLLNNIMLAHQPHQLIRVTTQFAVPIGWFVLEKLQRQHQFIGHGGYGRVINFDASFQRVDIPPPESYLASVAQVMLSE